MFFALGQKLKRYFPKLDNSTLIASGGAAGIAAAFNTPLGGIVFAIEELIGPHFHRMRSSMLIAVIIAGMVAQSLVGPYLVFGSLNVASPDFGIMGPTLLVSCLMGVLGGLSCKSFMFIHTWLSTQTLRSKYLFTAVLGLALGTLLTFTHSDLLAGGGIPLIRDLLWKPTQISPWLGFEKWLGMMLTFMSGIAGGFFAPALAVGAIFGKIAAQILALPQATTLILIGMVSLLSSMARAPFTALVLVSEMSNSHAVILPLMIASLVGLFVSRLVEKRSYYHFQSEHWKAQLIPKEKAS
ncbi:MAG: hypothetical protein EOP10_05210 [Proteobacteria bacterium]|nr:MAG: hypothetical protein EOP10_05210 [Pseudomonadota bacterium]